MTTAATDTGLQRRHRRVAVWCGALAVAMAALAFAAVPLYSLFCQVTGSGGTTQRADRPSAAVLERTVTIRFDANTAPGLSWTFEPLVRTVEVKVGESTLAHYRATNTSSRLVTGMATFNVAPEVAGAYFSKLECFCFREQRLEPGQSVDMPVSFFVDPAIERDKDAARLTQITLSYTFFAVDDGKAGGLEPAPGSKPPRKGS